MHVALCSALIRLQYFENTLPHTEIAYMLVLVSVSQALHRLAIKVGFTVFTVLGLGFQLGTI